MGDLWTGHDKGHAHTLHPLVPPWRPQGRMQIYTWSNTGKSSTCPPYPPPPARSSIWVSAVRPGFLPSDNQALISPALLSCSRSFLSQFR